MIRIIMLLVVVAAILGFFSSSWLKKTPPEILRKRLRKFGAYIVLLIVVLLAASGKLNWLFAALGVVIAFVVRMAPAILHYAPRLHGLWTMFNGARQRQQSSSPMRSGTMTQAEALQVLGLKAGASEADIIAAHRKLISRLHPDKGGSDYLAAQINLAKKVLMEH